MPTNAERAASALAAVSAMNKHRGDPEDEIELEYDMRDLVTNTLHLAHQRGFDIDNLLDGAKMNFDEERCLTPLCDGNTDDGEGFDGYCGNCADRREKG